MPGLAIKVGFHRWPVAPIPPKLRFLGEAAASVGVQGADVRVANLFRHLHASDNLGVCHVFGVAHVRSSIKSPLLVRPHRLHPAATKQKPGLRLLTASARTNV